MEEIAEMYNMPYFPDLKTPTITSMVFTNMIFDQEKIFYEIPITQIEQILTKKKKKIDKKNLKAPYGTVFSATYCLKVRGIYMKKKKNYWCTFCQLYKTKYGNLKTKQKTVEEVLMALPSYLTNKVEGVKKVIFFCKNCKWYYEREKVQKIVGFLNQLTLVVSLGDVNINVMIFKDNIKIAGCRNERDIYQTVMILWENYISQIPGAWKYRDNIEPYKILKYESDLGKGLTERPHFLCSVVMKNYDFCLGFSLDRKKTQLLLDRPEYKEKIQKAVYESTGRTNVGVKMYSKKPEGTKIPCLIYESDENKNFKPYFEHLSSHVFRKKKKKKKDCKCVTFMIFGSSEIILSGRYERETEELYYYFIKIMFENKNFISFKINKPKISLDNYIAQF